MRKPFGPPGAEPGDGTDRASARPHVILPSYFVSYDDGLRSILNPLWNRPEMQDVQTHGCSFWIQML